jgi:hypothetical protein
MRGCGASSLCSEDNKDKSQQRVKTPASPARIRKKSSSFKIHEIGNGLFSIEKQRDFKESFTHSSATDILSPSLSTDVISAISRPSGLIIDATWVSERSVTTAIDGPTELIPTNSKPASRSLAI